MKSRQLIFDIIIWTSVAVIATIDFITPYGYSFWQPYVIILLLSFWSDRRKIVYVIASVCTVLIIADHLLTFHGPDPLGTTIKSVLAIFVLWIVAVLCALHKAALSKLKRSNDELEIKVKERTLELDQTIEKLKNSNEELEHFAYVASHDLQEPLRMITSYIQLLTKKYEEKLDPKANEYIGFINDGARRMLSMITDLLKYARITTRQKPMEIIDFNNLIEDVITDLQVKIMENQAEINISPLPKLMADPTQIRQLFQNLISNAIKFRGEHIPEVNITANRQESEWYFCVRDNGIGIESKYYERIFMLFQRLHEREKYPGTGIGLTVCKKIVERHGGRMWVESELGKGTAFYFTFPIN